MIRTTRATYDPTSDMIRADLSPDDCPAEIHAGPEGHAVVLRLTQPNAVRLRNQLAEAIHRAEQAKQRRPWPAPPSKPKATAGAGANCIGPRVPTPHLRHLLPADEANRQGSAANVATGAGAGLLGRD
jgi:hypothetical protein